MPNEPIEQLLEMLGLTQKEAQVYIAIQKQGRTAPADLAEITKINRTTVYSVAKELLNKGIIVEDLGSPKRELLATPPQELRKLIDQELNAIKQRESFLDEAIKSIKSIAADATYPVPRIQFIKEDRLESFLYERTPVWDKSIVERGGEYLGFQEPIFVEKFEDWIDWYWSQAPATIQLTLLSAKNSEAESRVSSKGYDRRQIIFWKNTVTFNTTTWVMGDYVVMFVLSTSPNYLVEIYDQRFAENQRILFKGILKDMEAFNATKGE